MNCGDRGDRLARVLSAGALGLFLSACGGGGSSGGVKYTTLDYPLVEADGSTLLTGVRAVDASSDVYISGFYQPPDMGDQIGLIYEGSLSGDGLWHELVAPSIPGATVTDTALYGPDDTGDGAITVVGSYNTQENGAYPIGLLYQGPLDGSGTWRPLTPPGSQATIAHSTMGGFVVGNYDTDRIAVPAKAFIYDIARDTYYDLVKDGAVSITAYGIWSNGGSSYTITGGATQDGVLAGYLVDWDAVTHAPSNWTAYRFNNQTFPSTLLTHFEGITSDGSGGYDLAFDAATAADAIRVGLAHVPRTSSGGFGTASWKTISYPDSTVTSANTVIDKTIIGVYQPASGGGKSGYVASLP